MKHLFLIHAAAFCIFGITGAVGQAPVKWQNLSYESNGVYGAGVREAHGLAKGMKPKKKVTVALVGYGINVAHEAIKHAIWVNPKEKINGRDDDRDGRVDDIHGWNFLGNDTATVNTLSRAGDREFFRFKDKYASYLAVVDDKLYCYDSVAGAVVEAAFPDDRKEFDYFRGVMAESEIGQAYMGIRLAKAVVWFIHEVDGKLRQEFPGKQFTKQDFRSLDKRDASTLEQNLYGLVELVFMSAGTDSWDKMVEYADTEYVPYQRRRYERILKNKSPRERLLVGDNPDDLGDTRYGNNNLRADNAGFGTMLADIIAKTGGDAGKVKIMTLRVDADEYGESYVKDVALAIRYAADKGADIIQLGKSNTLYPYPSSRWVDEALQYAERKGILVVVPVMDYSYNLDDQPFYPNRRIQGGELSNLITVAASDSLGNPYKYANFSETELDIFAPGVRIDAACLDRSSAEGSGSAFAAAMVTGAAALIKTYYPGITPAATRRLLMENVTRREEAEVEKQFYMYRNGQKERLATDLFLFTELCASGGILNVEKAFKAAKHEK
jgi:hypothetical protein